MKNLRVFSSICLLMLSALPLRGWAAAKNRLVVAATIFPIADIARRVAGPDVSVIQILPPGASPHTFDLTPTKVGKLQPARLVFKIGGVDDWIDGFGANLPRAAIIALDKNIKLLPFHGEGHGHDHGERGQGNRFDPHYWLSAANGISIARNIAAALTVVDRARAAFYEANCRKYCRELAELHDEIKNELSALETNKMLVFHDAWRYFAAAYGLEVVAVFQYSPGREPTPRAMQRLYAAVGRAKIKVIFSEPQLPVASVEPLTRDLDLKVVVIDPIGGAEPGDSYADLLRRNARAVRLALEH